MDQEENAIRSGSAAVFFFVPLACFGALLTALLPLFIHWSVATRLTSPSWLRCNALTRA